MNQHPDLAHPKNYRCGRCGCFKTDRCPNPEDLAIAPFQNGRVKDEDAIACMLIRENYVPDFGGNKLIEQSKNGVRSYRLEGICSEVSESYAIEVMTIGEKK